MADTGDLKSPSESTESLTSNASSENSSPALALPLTFSAPSAPCVDPDLARVVNRWQDLPEPIRRAILALVESVG